MRVILLRHDWFLCLKAVKFPVVVEAEITNKGKAKVAWKELERIGAFFNKNIGEPFENYYFSPGAWRIDILR